jgi:uncharacterized membrane protein (UPF0127 family)
MRTVEVTIEASGSMLGEQVEVADTSWTRMRGLLGRQALGKGEGLWIRPSSGVHTLGMSFAIDVIGLDKSMQVIKLWRELAPQRITSLHWRMSSVLELPAGAIAESGVQLGDRIHIPKRPPVGAAR